MAERFGRVRIKAKEHLTFVEDRLSSAQEALSLPEHINQAVFSLLHRMLAFDEADRPDASEVAKTMRGLARQLTQGALEDWSEDALPSIVELFQNQTDDGGDPLVGRCVQEDPFDDEDTPGENDPLQSPSKSTLWAHQVPTREDVKSVPHSELDEEEQNQSFLLPVAVFGLSLLLFILGTLGLVVAILWPSAS